MQLKFQCIKRIIKGRKFLDVSKNSFNSTKLQEIHISKIFRMIKYKTIGKSKSGTQRDRDVSGKNNILKS